MLFGLIIGAAVVFFFSGLAIMAVGRAAGRVVYEESVAGALVTDLSRGRRRGLEG